MSFISTAMHLFTVISLRTTAEQDFQLRAMGMPVALQFSWLGPTLLSSAVTLAFEEIKLFFTNDAPFRFTTLACLPPSFYDGWAVPSLIICLACSLGILKLSPAFCVCCTHHFHDFVYSWISAWDTQIRNLRLLAPVSWLLFYPVWNLLRYSWTTPTNLRIPVVFPCSQLHLSSHYNQWQSLRPQFPRTLPQNSSSWQILPPFLP